VCYPAESDLSLLLLCFLRLLPPINPVFKRGCNTEERAAEAASSPFLVLRYTNSVQEKGNLVHVCAYGFQSGAGLLSCCCALEVFMLLVSLSLITELKGS